MRRDHERLQDILESIEKVEKYTCRGRSAFEQDELIQTWVIHHIQIIGEASRKLSDDLLEKYPHIPWAEIVAMRNILVHEYFGIDPDEVWVAVERDLPKLKISVQRVIAELPK